eukprot:TRINITY_DN3670_c0_g1_i1.p1 TRINITY_DN3670_c0_g1~~TRINITY_DN3670_c0_g1_i1.p1  ORF type:complete len:143 (+),score=28.28 TRINITY_DN3670_c0_g1_i1:874-1302(+)
MEERTCGPNAEPLTWDMFDKFYDKYFPTYARDQKEEEFMLLIQGGMSVAAFEAKFAEWSRFATHLINMEIKKAKRFQNGLKLNLRASFAPFLSQNYADLVKRAIVLEGELAETQKIRDKKTKNKIPNANQGGRNSQQNNSNK